MLNWTEAQIEDTYLKDYRELFGDQIEPEWSHTSPSRTTAQSSCMATTSRDTPEALQPLPRWKSPDLPCAGNHRLSDGLRD